MIKKRYTRSIYCLLYMYGDLKHLPHITIRRKEEEEEEEEEEKEEKEEEEKKEKKRMSLVNHDLNHAY